MTPRILAVLTLSMAYLSLAITLAGCTDSSLQPVQAGEVVDLLSQGKPVYCEGVVIRDLDLRSLPEHRVSAPLYLVNSSLVNASFDDLAFENEVSFWGTSFNNSSFNNTSFKMQADLSDTAFDGAYFQGASFDQPVIFDGAAFEKDASFMTVLFSGDADFNYSTFGYYVYFSGSRFSGRAHFSDVEFQGPLDFSSASFGQGASFFRSVFEEGAGFWGSTFQGPTSFGLSRFDGLTSFTGCSFEDEANFNLAKFGDALDFEGTSFDKDALFGLCSFERLASFRKSEFGGDLNLKGSSTDSMVLENVNFGKGCRIILNDTQFSHLRIPWAEIKDHIVYEPGAYLALIDNYHGMGWAEDEDDCYYQYRRLEHAHKPWSLSKLVDMMAWVTCGYGVMPSYTVAWSLIIIISFALIFWRNDGIRRSSKPFQGGEVDPVPERATLRNALFFSTMIFLSQGLIDFLPVGRHRYLVIIEGIHGWLMLALFLVTLGRIMIR